MGRIIAWSGLVLLVELGCSAGGGDSNEGLGADSGLVDAGGRSSGGGAGVAGGGGVGGSSGTGGTAPIVTSKRAACRIYVEAACQRLADCSGDQARYDSCVNYEESCPDYLFSPGSLRTIENVLACAEMFQIYSCEDLSVNIYPPCAMGGTRQPGDTCIHSSQCTSNECSGTTSECGVCERLAAPGEDCNVYGVACPPGQECTATGCQDAVPIPGVVWSEVGAGEPCSSYDRCPEGYYCLREVVSGGTCMLPPAVGSPCGSIASGGIVCTEGSYCAEDGYCRAMPAVGQPCDTLGTISVCATDTYCAEDGYCRAKPAAGQPCALVTYGTGSVCAENAYCENGVCAAKSGSGEPCQAAYTSNTLGECLEGLVCTCIDSCTSAACRYMREDGERCDDPNTECVDGTECTGGRCVATDEVTLFTQLCGE